MSTLEDWEGDEKAFLKSRIEYANDRNTQSKRIFALIDTIRKKDALVQSTLSLLEECGMPSNAQEHEWLTEAIALTEKLDYSP